MGVGEEGDLLPLEIFADDGVALAGKEEDGGGVVFDAGDGVDLGLVGMIEAGDDIDVGVVAEAPALHGGVGLLIAPIAGVGADDELAGDVVEIGFLIGRILDVEGFKKSFEIGSGGAVLEVGTDGAHLLVEGAGLDEDGFGHILGMLGEIGADHGAAEGMTDEVEGLLVAEMFDEGV